jgi:uncharacterized secreted protein with C-terminal beta-propeller domain
MSDINTIEEGEATSSTKADAFPPTDTVKPTPSKNRKVWHVSIAFAFAAVIALSLGLGLGLPRDENSSSLQQNDNTTNGSTATNGSGNNTSSNQASNPIGGDNPITFASRLTTISDKTIQQVYDSCDSLNDDLSILAHLIANRTIESNYWYFDQPTTYYEQPIDGGGIAADGNTADTNAGTQELVSAPEGSATKAVSESNFGTNNQVEGVEEGDFVQSNGDQVFVVYGSEIIVLAADTVNITSRTKIPNKSDNCSIGYVASMLLIDDRLVVVATSYCSQGVASDSTTSSASEIFYVGQDSSDVYIYNTSNMLLVETINLSGSFISARGIGSNVHIVTSTYFDSYVLTQYLEPWRDDIYGVNVTKSQYREKAQEQVVEHLQEFVDKVTQGLDCTSLQKIALFQNSDDELKFSSIVDSIATVTSFTLKSDSISTSVKSMMLPSGGYTVYASAEYLILAVQGWWVNDAAIQQTYLISYKLDGPTSNATSLGTVPGYILNQFSIDHAVQDGENFLRVASTTFAQWAEINGDWIQNTNSTSQVTVLKLDDASRMSVVGTVSDLGKNGETIYSVRFLGDRGFITTFETTDPFYTLDLSDPSNPTKVGELEIPGYSSYLYPVGNDLIIGVGQATDSNGTALGVQISLFDVSSFSNPVRIQTFSDIGNSNVSSTSYSEAEYDFKAFRYLNSSQLLIIPITIYNYSPCNYTFEYPVVNDTFIPPSDGNVSEGSGGVSSSSAPSGSEILIDPIPGPCYEATGGFDGFRVYEVKTDGITSYLSIKHDVADWTKSCWSGAFLPTRSLVFDGDLMTLKTHTILSHDLSTLAEDATPINLDDQNTVCEPYILF